MVTSGRENWCEATPAFFLPSERVLSPAGHVVSSSSHSVHEWLHYRLQNVDVNIGGGFGSLFRELRWHNISFAAYDTLNLDRRRKFCVHDDGHF